MESTQSRAQALGKLLGYGKCSKSVFPFQSPRKNEVQAFRCRQTQGCLKRKEKTIKVWFPIHSLPSSYAPFLHSLQKRDLKQTVHECSELQLVKAWKCSLLSCLYAIML